MHGLSRKMPKLNYNEGFKIIFNKTDGKEPRKPVIQTYDE